MSTIVWFVMNVLGEMTTYLPIRGVSVPYLIGRFTEPSIGFAAGMCILSLDTAMYLLI
jgi:amino acid transporter